MKAVLPPGLLVAAPGSSAGKTVATLGLIRALRGLGLHVRAAKTGPDFIDAGFLAAASGAPAANLDAWMGAPGRTRRPRALPAGPARLRRRLLAPDGARPPDLWVVEGAMGLYDGGPGGAGGAAELAALLDLPVLLVLNVRGMGQSVAALAEGFLRHKPRGARPRFLGVLCTQSGGEGHERLLREALAPVLRREKLPLLGFLPRADAPEIASRHLGLVEAREALAGLDLDGLGRWFAAHCDLRALLRALGLAMSGRTAATGTARGAASAHSETPAAFFPGRARRAPRVRIGIARDAAFSFCYADLPALLGELGAKPVFFSPLADPAPPEGCAGLYFPGGYPELHAAALAANTAMLAALRALGARGLPVFGECGGYIYLMRELEHDGRRHALAGLLPLACQVGGRLAALGYREATALPGWLPEGMDPITVRGHEFHYARLSAPERPPACQPLWRVTDAAGEPRGLEGCRLGRVAGSWLHLYPEGSRRFWKAWLALAAASPSPSPRPELPCP